MPVQHRTRRSRNTHLGAPARKGDLELPQSPNLRGAHLCSDTPKVEFNRFTHAPCYTRTLLHPGSLPRKSVRFRIENGLSLHFFEALTRPLCPPAKRRDTYSTIDVGMSKRCSVLHTDRLSPARPKACYELWRIHWNV